MSLTRVQPASCCITAYSSTGLPLRASSAVLRDNNMLPDARNAACVAWRTGIPTPQMGRIRAGVPVNTKEALRFAVAFNTSALYWRLLKNAGQGALLCRP